MDECTMSVSPAASTKLVSVIYTLYTQLLKKTVLPGVTYSHLDNYTARYIKICLSWRYQSVPFRRVQRVTVQARRAGRVVWLIQEVADAGEHA
jgi:hypothetical protein